MCNFHNLPIHADSKGKWTWTLWNRQVVFKQTRWSTSFCDDDDDYFFLSSSFSIPSAIHSCSYCETRLITFAFVLILFLLCLSSSGRVFISNVWILWICAYVDYGRNQFFLGWIFLFVGSWLNFDNGIISGRGAIKMIILLNFFVKNWHRKVIIWKLIFLPNFSHKNFVHKCDK